MGCKGNYGKFQFNRKEKHTIEGGQTLGQVAKKQRGNAILEDTPNLAGGGLGNLLKWGQDELWPSPPAYTILCFCDTRGFVRDTYQF